jgi:NlpC/P60 family
MWNLGVILSALITTAVCGLPAFATESMMPVRASIAHTIEETVRQPEFQTHLRKLDCSHLVHALYNRLGLSYPYATSRSLYRGIEAFRQVAEPESGDSVVWRAHVGIVIDPSGHKFLSVWRNGVRTASYLSSY